MDDDDRLIRNKSKSDAFEEHFLFQFDDLVPAFLFPAGLHHLDATGLGG